MKKHNIASKIAIPAAALLVTALLALAGCSTPSADGASNNSSASSAAKQQPSGNVSTPTNNTTDSEAPTVNKPTPIDTSSDRGNHEDYSTHELLNNS